MICLLRFTSVIYCDSAEPVRPSWTQSESSATADAIQYLLPHLSTHLCVVSSPERSHARWAEVFCPSGIALRSYNIVSVESDHEEENV